MPTIRERTGVNSPRRYLSGACGPSGRKVGKVELVGAGPGDPMLLTLRAMQSIEQADVIVYDRLVSKEIRACFPATTQTLYVGKAKGEHSVSQEAINELLVELAWQGKTVCRLKGGDAFIFGRGSEEMLVLKAAEVPVEVVPGITAAAGCTSYAGIPLTHRGYSQGCTFVTGHAEQSLDLNWQALAQLEHTLVFYMGVTKSALIRDKLLAGGAAPTTPVALVEKGCCPEQRTVTGQLQHLPELVERHQVISPALIVVGEVVALSEQLQWLSQAADLQQQKQLKLSA
ncbi:uroporphyrinogen-III C-methyltransferase [Photobacterium sp. BZF1]|uniref:uroporphyrinogen-III C-methyltransferase n=1 Tax=Photobacterium sp. BZF1 TaxID=1904457 RepID=UPI001653BF8F|nr:uroporphyrinogen-III C-methyltransferase [Photobacterium sp. BZF1]MBC7005170.1 uroporphyrinogen-III C-methyltransferase [Photobacterium sp. BZF1]